MRILLLLLVLLIPSAAEAIPVVSKYDGFFIKYTRRYLPYTDSDLIKAQCWQESKFVETAVSPVGASGICQFMPATWREVSKNLDLSRSISKFHPEYNIQAAAYYMGVQYRYWSSPRSIADRHNLAAASYNAGAGNLITAQKRCNGPLEYREIIKCLPKVTGNNSIETIGYVKNIRKFYAELKVAKREIVPDDGL